MNTTNNTILITGGGSGIGRALAETLHKRGNRVIIAGRGQEALHEVVAANPGMESVVVDISDGASIKSFAEKLMQAFPNLDTIFHVAGIMRAEQLTAGSGSLETAEATIATNLLGPIRLNTALLPHLLQRPRAAIVTVSSGLAFLPMAQTPTYCATKAAVHSYTQSLRYQLKNTPVQIIELVPPYVRTSLMGERQAEDPRAMPLAEYIEETMKLLESQPDANEILVERVLPLRYAAGKNDGYDAIFTQMNDQLASRDT